MSMSLKSPWQPHNQEIYRYFIYNTARTLHSSYLWTKSGSRDLHSLSSCSSAGPAHDVRFDACACKEHITNSVDSFEQYVLSPFI